MQARWFSRRRFFLLNMMVLCLIILSSPEILAGYYRTPIRDVRLNSLEVKTEEGTSSRLLELSNNQQPLLLVPGYYRCQSSCSLLTEKLQQTLSSSQQKNFQVVFLSFDTHDDAATMRKYRLHHHLPADWLLTVVQSESSAKTELNRYGYQFHKIGLEYQHPNYLLIFSKNEKLWSGIITGTDIVASDFVQAFKDAQFTEQAPFTEWILSFFLRPEYWVMWGFGGILCSLGVISATLLSARNRQQKK